MKIFKPMFKILLPIFIISSGGVIAGYMIANRPVPQQEPVKEIEIPVQVYTAERVDVDLVIEGSGEVLPAKRITLQPQVSGKIIDIHPDFIPGGIFKTGDVLLQIDPRDYQYAVDQLEGRVEEAKMRLEEEQGRQTVALREWELIGEEVKTTEQGKSLALREPQIRSTKAAVKAAESAWKDAQLDLERTKIRAPFNCWIQSENVDPGQVVNPQSSIATLVGTDQYWVEAKIDTEDLSYVFVPGINSEKGSEVTVVHDAGPLQIRFPGRVIKLLGDMNTTGRQVQLLVEVNDPLGLQDGLKENPSPLFLGAYVNTYIQGKKATDVFSVPRAAVREGNRVWIRNQEGRLEIQQVEILKKRRDDVLVTRGIKSGQQIVTSILATPLPGIKLVVEKTEETDLGSVEITERPTVTQ